MKTIQDRKTLIANALGNGAYFQVSKRIIQEVGNDAAILLSHLIDIWKNYEKMPNEFYQQQDRLMASTFLTEHELRKATKRLVNANLIGLVKKGLPSKYFYSINVDQVYEVMHTEFEPVQVQVVDRTGSNSGPVQVQTVDHRDRETRETETPEKKKNRLTRVDAPRPTEAASNPTPISFPGTNESLTFQGIELDDMFVQVSQGPNPVFPGQSKSVGQYDTFEETLVKPKPKGDDK